jgi:hypothetical protein
MHVQSISFQSNIKLPVRCKNYHPISPVIELILATLCLFCKSQFVESGFLTRCGIRITNNAGIPMAGKKFGATPNRYSIVAFAPS